MNAFLRIGMFIKRRPVKPDKSMLIRRKMGWYPVQYDPDPAVVRRLDEIRKSSGVPNRAVGA